MRRNRIVSCNLLATHMLLAWRKFGTMVFRGNVKMCDDNGQLLYEMPITYAEQR